MHQYGAGQFRDPAIRSSLLPGHGYLGHRDYYICRGLVNALTGSGDPERIVGSSPHPRNAPVSTFES